MSVGDKIFVVPSYKMEQFQQLRKKHDKTCRIPEWQTGFSHTNKYEFRFQETKDAEPIIQMVCRCGRKLYATAGDDGL